VDLSREPIQKIFGSSAFYGQKLKIQEGLLNEEKDQDIKAVRFKEKYSSDIPSVIFF